MDGESRPFRQAGVSDEGTARSAARRWPVAGIVKGPATGPLNTAACTAVPETACRLAGGTLQSNISPLRQQNSLCGSRTAPAAAEQPCGKQTALPIRPFISFTSNTPFFIICCYRYRFLT